MTFHVTACSTCQAHWVVENFRRNDTVTCPACGSTRDTDKHRSLAQADDRDTACELRAKILADRAGEREAYANTGTYAETWDEIDITEPEDQDAFPGALTDTITEHREKYGDLVSLTPVHADAFEDQVDIALTEHRDKYSTRAEEIAGTIGRNEHTPDTPTSAHTGLTGTGHHPAHPATSRHARQHRPHRNTATHHRNHNRHRKPTRHRTLERNHRERSSAALLPQRHRNRHRTKLQRTRNATQHRRNH
ncbi:DUF5817 domain-containing protein [Halorubrum sp. AD140]|uniref:DUF5817 domain-containing protein n=1 Tax=Halorubrum sp. AD140 TaxID=3050073 RepID=UPI00350E5153